MDNESTTTWNENDYEAPRNSAEARIAEIWSRLLGIERVGIHDNFLLLGGESLLATQAASELRDSYNWEVSLRSIFVNTVAEIAAQIPQ